MADRTLINSVTDWLVDQSLAGPDIVDVFQGACERIVGVGVPIARAMLTYPTLHPLFDAESAVWRRDSGVEFEQYRYAPEAEAWHASPFKFMMESDTDLLRRRLTGPNALLDFGVLREFAEQGLTDYLAFAIAFETPQTTSSDDRSGIIVSWASDRESGFTDDDIEALIRIQRRFAVTAKTVIQSRIAANITETYLGQRPGARVLAGQIRRGDGETIRAVVWFSDIRNSTAIADRIPMADYLDLLNAFFECTADAALDAGGEVLDFVGDGVLAIFPIEGRTTVRTAVKKATHAVNDAIDRAAKVNRERRKKGLIAFEFGVGLSVGTVMFGNIGVPQRLSFSVIGPTVNEVSRIEKLSSQLDSPALATKSVADADSGNWVSVGHHHLAGVGEPMALYQLADRDSLPDAAQ